MNFCVTCGWLIDQCQCNIFQPEEFKLKHCSKLGEDWYEVDKDYLDKLRAEKVELIEALELANAALSGANMNMNVVQRKVTSALAKARGEVE